MGFFDKIKQSLTRTKEQFVERFDELVKRSDEPVTRSRPVDIETLDALEEALISADVGVAAADQIVGAVRSRQARGSSLRDLVKSEILSILQAAASPIPNGHAAPLEQSPQARRSGRLRPLGPRMAPPRNPRVRAHRTLPADEEGEVGA